jgi:iron(III) transport system ATP-binding protein
VRGVRKCFGDLVVLDDVDVDVGDGETVVLLGPSGCGKTTLLRLIAGLDHLDGGTVSLGDRVVSGRGVHLAPERRGVGLVFQDGALFPHLSVGRNIGYGLDRSERRGGDRVDELAELVGLAGAIDRQPDELSGGQQQRVALAHVLLLDEPFSNLDAALRERLRTQVRAIVAEAAMTTVFVTHDRVEAFALADRVALMRGGRIVQVGPPIEVYRRPVDRWAAELLGDVVVLDGESDGSSVATALGPLVAADGVPSGAVDVLARPEDVRLTAASGPDSATIQAIQPEGSTWSAASQLPSGDQVRVRGLGPCPWAVGDRATVTIEGRAWAVARSAENADGGRASVRKGHG